MSFLDHVRQILTDAAPHKYPVLIEKDPFAVEALHDDYVDVRFGSFLSAEHKTVEAVSYIRSMTIADIKSIQPMKDYHIVTVPGSTHFPGSTTVSLADIVRQMPNIVDEIAAFAKRYGKNKGSD